MISKKPDVFTHLESLCLAFKVIILITEIFSLKSISNCIIFFVCYILHLKHYFKALITALFLRMEENV